MAEKQKQPDNKPAKEAAPTEAAFLMRYTGSTSYPAEVIGVPGVWNAGQSKPLSQIGISEAEARKLAQETGLFEVVKEGEK